MKFPFFSLLKHSLFFLLLLILVTIVLLSAIGGGFGPKKYSNLSFPPDSLLLFAHRGSTLGVPENTQAAIQQAKVRGFLGLEIDLRKTLAEENKFILFHDEDGKRLLKYPKPIAQIQYQHLKNLPIYQDGEATSERVLTLETAWTTFGKDFIFYLDVKEDNQLNFASIATQLASLVRKYELEDRVIIAASNSLFIGYLEYHFPEINTALEGFNAGKEWIYNIIPKKFKPDYLAGFQQLSNSKHLEWLKKKGLLSRKIMYGATYYDLEKLTAQGLTKIIVDDHPHLNLQKK